jgi:hypothetical protein
MLRVKSSQVAAASFFALLAALGAGACGGSTTSNGSTGDDSGADGSSSDDGSGSSDTGPGTDSTMPDSGGPETDASEGGGRPDSGSSSDAADAGPAKDAADGGDSEPPADTGVPDTGPGSDASDGAAPQDSGTSDATSTDASDGGTTGDAGMSDGALEASSDAATPTQVVATCASGGTSLLSNLVGWWHGENNFNDEFGLDDGTNAGAAAFGVGVTGSAFSLTGGATSSVTIADSSTLGAIPAAGVVTMEAWINATALGGRIVDKITAGGTDGYLLDTVGGKLRVLVGSASVSSTTSLTTGVWTHVAGVYDGANLAVYINGAAAGTLAHAGAIPSNTLALHIGADSSGASRFSGSIDEVRIWNRAMNASQIATLYAAGQARMTQSSAQMVAWYSGDFNAAPATDVLGLNNGAAGSGVSTASGVLATAQSFSGLTGVFSSTPDAPSLDPTSVVTLEAWIDATALGGRIFDKITAGGTNGYLLDTVGNKLRMIVGSQALSTASSLSTGTWTHVAGVYDGANMTVYVNGAAAGTVAHTGAIPTNALTLRVGADSSGASLFSGLIDEARVYSRALSAADIQALYAESACQ